MSPGHNCPDPPSLANCPVSESYYGYRPGLGANGALLALFSIALLLHTFQGSLHRTWGFLISMFFGNVAEIIGYAGRIMMWKNPFELNPFLIQICCLTIAPAFLCAGIYLCLARIVIVFGEDISRIKPKVYQYAFICCDFISLVLVGAGGGSASVRSQNNEDPTLGNNLMLAGLSFQVFTLLVFILASLEYAFRVYRRQGEMNPIHAKLRSSFKVKGFLVALSFSTLLLFIRNVYRVVELAGGWGSKLMENQTLFIILEGVMVILAVLLLNAFHPGYCFEEGYVPGLKKKRGFPTAASSHSESQDEEK